MILGICVHRMQITVVELVFVTNTYRLSFLFENQLYIWCFILSTGQRIHFRPKCGIGGEDFQKRTKRSSYAQTTTTIYPKSLIEKRHQHVLFLRMVRLQFPSLNVLQQSVFGKSFSYFLFRHSNLQHCKMITYSVVFKHGDVS